MFVRRHRLRASPFRSILSTSGLVACYLPHMDVYGRNVSQYTTQPSMFLNLTRSGATYMETVGTGAHSCNIDSTETPTTYHYRVKITPIGRKRFLLGHGARDSWALFDTSSVSVIATGSDATDARIIANGDGTFDLSTGVVSGYNYPALYIMPDDATSPVGRKFAGDTSKGFVLHEWQVNLGLTLHPYTPPAGLSQILTDRSGQGNHAQLGSTVGEDTNDPSWGTNSLVFGGDDYCVLPTSAYSWVVGGVMAMAVNLSSVSIPGYFFSNGEPANLGLRYDGTTFLVNIGGGSPYPTWTVGVGNHHTIVACKRVASNRLELFVNGTSLGIQTSAGENTIAIKTIGSSAVPFAMDMSMAMLFSSLSTAQIVRMSYVMRTLLAGQGVSVA